MVQHGRPSCGIIEIVAVHACIADSWQIEFQLVRLLHLSGRGPLVLSEESLSVLRKFTALHCLRMVNELVHHLSLSLRVYFCKTFYETTHIPFIFLNGRVSIYFAQLKTSSPHL